MNSIGAFYSIRKNCRLCGVDALILEVPLQPIPIVSPNINETEAGVTQLLDLTAPLDIYRCQACGLMQVTTVLDPHLQYDNFMYETSVSLGLKEHFAELTETLMNEMSSNSFSVFEIGSNDGTLLNFFKEKGVAVLGLDPAKRIAEAASARGIPTYADFFTQKIAKKIVAQHGKMDLIISNNTLANIDDLSEIMEAIRDCISPTGLFVFESQYSLDVLEKFLLDVVYHEHLTYFSMKPLVTFFSSKKFEVVKVEHISPKGGSIRVYVQLLGGGRPVDNSVMAMIALEETKGLYTSAPYKKFFDQIKYLSQQITQAVDAIKNQNGDVVVYGSSVGCACLINQFTLGNRIRYIVDDNPFKKELVGHEYKLKVVGRDNLLLDMPSLVIILAWRYADTICKQNHDYLKKGGRFLIPLPKVSYISSLNKETNSLNLSHSAIE